METTLQTTMASQKIHRSLIVIQNAINNITRLNTHGQYNKKLEDLKTEKLEAETWIKENATIKRTKYIPSETEVQAIMGFNSDKRFSITE